MKCERKVAHCIVLSLNLEHKSTTDWFIFSIFLISNHPMFNIKSMRFCGFENSRKMTYQKVIVYFDRHMRFSKLIISNLIWVSVWVWCVGKLNSNERMATTMTIDSSPRKWKTRNAIEVFRNLLLCIVVIKRRNWIFFFTVNIYLFLVDIPIESKINNNWNSTNDNRH